LAGIALIAGLAAPGFGAITYDVGTETWTYAAAADLDSVVDPVGEWLDVPVVAQYGMTLAAYNALPPQVIHFNHASGMGNENILAIVAHYDAGDPSKTLTIDGFHGQELGGGRLGFGGWAQYGKYPFSGRNSPAGQPGEWDSVFNGGGGSTGRPWPGVCPVPDNDGLRFFGCDLTTSDGYELVTSFAFCARSNDTGPLEYGDVYFRLTDGTYGTVQYNDLGTGTAAGENMSIAYQAPAGLGICAIDGITIGGADGGSNQYLGMDDFAFTVTRHPNLPGDANLDCLVDGLDYVAWSNNYNQAATWETGDFNDDQFADGLDYVVWSNNYGASIVCSPPTPGAVPEPATMALLAIGGLALIRRRR